MTQGPGLIGSLLVGVCAAKAIAWQRELPLLAVNHLEGHVRSAFIEHPDIEFPAIALVVSGGHTVALPVPRGGRLPAAGAHPGRRRGRGVRQGGQAARPGLPRRAGDRAAGRGGRRAGLPTFPLARMKDHSLDFSFSGLKTAVRRDRAAGGAGPTAAPRRRGASPRCGTSWPRSRGPWSTCWSGARCAVCRREAVRTVLVTGGVACNGRLRRAFAKAGRPRGPDGLPPVAAVHDRQRGDDRRRRLPAPRARPITPASTSTPTPARSAAARTCAPPGAARTLRWP